MDKNTKKVKEQVLKKLGKLKGKQEEVENLVNEIEDKIEEINGEIDKPLKTGYGTSCVNILSKKDKLLTEY